ncbi:MAG: YlbF family regulator [Anaerolineae bacterium]|jgi:cell fate (sporulation/competence/biofilm development) regulator YlbF (YheA/YmcA/DUF963 family)
MGLPEDVRQAAQELGRSLGASYAVQSYLAAQAQLESDPDASALELRFQTLYQDLLARQRAGEDLPQEELNEFYGLRERVQSHPLIVERELALGELKSYLVDIALELSVRLQVDYPTLAQAS